MIQILTAATILSLLHAVLPNHWLPVLAIARRENWTVWETIRITLLAGVAHALSTILIGILVAFAAVQIDATFTYFTSLITPIVLISLGAYFIWQHYRHQHFHLRQKEPKRKLSKVKLVTWLVIAMFFSPCLEIEAFYLAAGGIGWQAVLYISLIYLFISVAGMVLWVSWAYRRLMQLNWHRLEHYSGIITGIILVLTGFSFLFIH